MLISEDCHTKGNCQRVPTKTDPKGITWGNVYRPTRTHSSSMAKSETKPNTKTKPDKLINGCRDTNESSGRRDCRRRSTQIAGKKGGTTNMAMPAMNSGSIVGARDPIGQTPGGSADRDGHQQVGMIGVPARQDGDQGDDADQRQVAEDFDGHDPVAITEKRIRQRARTASVVGVADTWRDRTVAGVVDDQPQQHHTRGYREHQPR